MSVRSAYRTGLRSCSRGLRCPAIGKRGGVCEGKDEGFGLESRHKLRIKLVCGMLVNNLIHNTYVRVV
jgi:hypothetical protein